MIIALYRCIGALFYALLLLLIAGITASAWCADLPAATPAATADDWQHNADAALSAVTTLAQALVKLTQDSATGFWAVLGTAGLALLYVGKRLAPLLRLAGPWGAVIDGAWSFAATLDQKKADQVQIAVTSAAGTAKPLMDALRAAPLDALPDNVRETLSNPHIALALETLATKPATA